MVICWGSPADGPAAYFVTWGTPPTKNEPWSQTSSGSSRYGFSSGFSHADALDVAAISADVRARSGPFLVFMVFLLRWCFLAGGRMRVTRSVTSTVFSVARSSARTARWLLAPQGFGMLRLHVAAKSTPSVDVRKGGATMNRCQFVCAFDASAGSAWTRDPGHLAYEAKRKLKRRCHRCSSAGVFRTSHLASRALRRGEAKSRNARTLIGRNRPAP